MNLGMMIDTVDTCGKVIHLGLSNVSAEQAGRAHSIHPIAAVECEYPLWQREVEAELLPCLRELGISLVAWAPLGRGFLAGAMHAPTEGDIRQDMPQYIGEN